MGSFVGDEGGKDWFPKQVLPGTQHSTGQPAEIPYDSYSMRRKMKRPLEEAAFSISLYERCLRTSP
jgi:hypothetical protein